MSEFSGPHRLWTEKEESLLGTLPDWQVAVKTGRTEKSVALRRQSLGIEPYWSRRQWMDRDDALLGTDTDKRIAKRLKTTVRAVYNRRRRLGIKAKQRKS